MKPRPSAAALRCSRCGTCPGTSRWMCCKPTCAPRTCCGTTRVLGCCRFRVHHLAPKSEYASREQEQVMANEGLINLLGWCKRERESLQMQWEMLQSGKFRLSKDEGSGHVDVSSARSDFGGLLFRRPDVLAVGSCRARPPFRPPALARFVRPVSVAKSRLLAERPSVPRSRQRIHALSSASGDILLAAVTKQLLESALGAAWRNVVPNSLLKTIDGTPKP
jgi:hypothetical protein